MQKKSHDPREGKSSAARQPAAQMTIPKPTANKKCFENPPFQRLPEVPAAIGDETFSWPDLVSYFLATASSSVNLFVSLGNCCLPMRKRAQRRTHFTFWERRSEGELVKFYHLYRK